MGLVEFIFQSIGNLSTNKSYLTNNKNIHIEAIILEKSKIFFIMQHRITNLMNIFKTR